MLKAPEFALDADDAKRLADATANLMNEYKAVALTPKQEALADLLLVAGQIYPAMVGTYILRKQIEARKGKPPQAPGAAPAQAKPPGPVPPPPPPQANTKQAQREAAEAAPNSVLPQGFDPLKIGIPDGSWNKKPN